MTRRNSKIITELADKPLSLIDATPVVAEEERRSSRLASKESQHYEPVAKCARKIRHLRDALCGCTGKFQKQIKKHAALAGYAKPLRKY
jgi:hypothetical protein